MKKITTRTLLASNLGAFSHFILNCTPFLVCCVCAAHIFCEAVTGGSLVLAIIAALAALCGAWLSYVVCKRLPSGMGVLLADFEKYRQAYARLESKQAMSFQFAELNSAFRDTFAEFNSTAVRSRFRSLCVASFSAPR